MGLFKITLTLGLWLPAHLAWSHNSDTTIDFETEEEAPVWVPGGPLLEEGHIPPPERDDRPASRWEGEYANCIANEQRNGVPLGEAIQNCRDKKGGNGDVGDIVGTPQDERVFDASYDNAQGELVVQWLSEQEMNEILTDLQRQRIRLDITDDEVRLVQMTATGASVLQSFPRAQWTHLFQPRLPQAEQLARSQRLAGDQIRRSMAAPLRFMARRLSGAVYGTPALAGDACNPYREPQGLAHLLSRGRQFQIQAAQSCNRLPRMLQVIRDNLN
jgi:hypothetical protein